VEENINSVPVFVVAAILDVVEDDELLGA